MAPLSGCAVRTPREGPLREENPRSLAERQISGPLPEATAGVGGGAVVHNYYDHRTQQYRQQTLTQEEMIGRYISHVPAKHFKMVRYYGFLSGRKRGELLPKVYEALHRAARLRRADEGVPAHGSVQMRPVWQPAALQQCTGWQTHHGVSGRKTA